MEGTAAEGLRDFVEADPEAAEVVPQDRETVDSDIQEMEGRAETVIFKNKPKYFEFMIG
jgi:hypothetical protein